MENYTRFFRVRCTHFLASRLGLTGFPHSHIVEETLRSLFHLELMPRYSRKHRITFILFQVTNYPYLFKSPSFSNDLSSHSQNVHSEMLTFWMCMDSASRFQLTVFWGSCCHSNPPTLSFGDFDALCLDLQGSHHCPSSQVLLGFSLIFPQNFRTSSSSSRRNTC